MKLLGRTVCTCFRFAVSANVASETVTSVVTPHQVTERARELSFSLQPYQHLISQLLYLPPVENKLL